VAQYGLHGDVDIAYHYVAGCNLLAAAAAAASSPMRTNDLTLSCWAHDSFALACRPTMTLIMRQSSYSNSSHYYGRPL